MSVISRAGAGAAILLLAGMISLPVRAQEAMVERAATRSSRDVQVPRVLVDRIEKEYRAFLKKAGVSGTPPITRHLLDLSVEFKQKRPVALHDDTRVMTPRGGGVIDLSEIVTPLRGAFWMKIRVRTEEGLDVSNPRVIFISHARERDIDGDSYGAGCDTFMEISDYFKSEMSGAGFKLYTADQRYASVVDGTFVIFQFTPEALNVGSLTFEDSRYPRLACD